MKKALIVGLILVLFFISLHHFYYNSKYDQITRTIYFQTSKELKTVFQEEVEKQQGRTAALTYLLSQDQK